ncbi:MAG: crossover junction endodeoxyribonuclease RuvC, partial [Candidatus Sumerlaeota bacterium]
MLMRILGIDPGLASVGWGLIDYPNGGPESVEWGTIKTAAHTPTPLRLAAIHKGVEALVSEI